MQQELKDPKHDYVHYDHIKDFGEYAERTKNHPTKITPGVILTHSIICPPLKFEYQSMFISLHCHLTDWSD